MVSNSLAFVPYPLICCRYLAPELKEEGRQLFTNKVDIYSFGVILNDVVSGVRLHQDAVLPNLVNADLNQNIANSIKNLIAECIDRNPAARPSSADVTVCFQRSKTPLGESLTGQSLNFNWYF